MNIPREFIELLLARIDLVDLINAQIPLQKKSGSNYFARCPFHNEKSASFSVSQPKQFYYCFGCGAHGNAIDFMMQHERLTFPEAIETLARQTGMEIPQSSNGYVKKEDTSKELFKLMAEVANDYYEQMKKSPRAIQYLKGRGIEGKTAQQFQLGYAPTGWSHILDIFGQSDAQKKQLLDVGLVIKKDEGGYYDRFRDRLMFPIHDYRGRMIGFGGRILDQGEPKYLNSPETVLFQKGHELYGLYQALESNRKLTQVLVVEGYMDVVALFQSGITYAVATLGTATTSHHLHRLVRYTNEIIFCFDGDQAGRTAAWRALQVIFPLMQDQLQIRFLFLPDGEDPDSIVQKEGKQQFEKRLSSALSLSGFLFQTLSQESDLSTMEGRARFTASALNYIKQLPAEILKGMMLDELSKRARVNLDELKQQTKQTEEARPEKIFPLQDVTLPIKAKLPAPARLVMALLLQHPTLVESIPSLVPFQTTPWYPFLSQLIQVIKENQEVTPGMLLERWRGEKEEAFIAKLIQWEHTIPQDGIKSEFIGSLRQLTLLSYDEEINRLMAKAGQGDLSNEEKIELSSWIGKKKSVVGGHKQAQIIPNVV